MTISLNNYITTTNTNSRQTNRHFGHSNLTAKGSTVSELLMIASCLSHITSSLTSPLVSFVRLLLDISSRISLSHILLRLELSSMFDLKTLSFKLSSLSSSSSSRSVSPLPLSSSSWQLEEACLEVCLPREGEEPRCFISTSANPESFLTMMMVILFIVVEWYPTTLLVPEIYPTPQLGLEGYPIHPPLVPEWDPNP